MSSDLNELLEFDEIDTFENESSDNDEPNDIDLSECVPLSVELSESICRSAAAAMLNEQPNSSFVRGSEIFLRMDNGFGSTTTTTTTITTSNSSKTTEAEKDSFESADDVIELQYENEFIDYDADDHDSGRAQRSSRFESENEQLLFEGKQIKSYGIVWRCSFCSFVRTFTGEQTRNVE